MSERNRLLQAIAAIIEDYQAGILATPTPAHVERWINQFPQAVQQPILAEMEHVLGKTYFSKARVRKFIKSLIHHHGWTGGDDAAFWQQINFLDLQPRGDSQRELLSLFDENLQKELGLSIAQCGQGNKFIYLDDGLFSGGRIGTDLKNWITNVAPANAELFIALIAIHTQGHYFTEKSLREANVQSGKNLTIKWGRLISIEDGLFAVDASDVLRPTGPGNDPAIAAYVTSLGKEQKWRTGTNVGPLQFFSSHQGRHLLEQEFLRAGVAVRAMCPNFNAYQRPLGNTTMRTIGFGTMFATYRNCPNNAPLVLWASDPWYPLLRRVTN
ncbi:hypothetical protein J8J14_22505 [Roseomonas sp. SSH11]|uniref:PRTase-CE domain-containing protein n=1 Tax=Pararoseomonas baculiformis TaxID=2820812 RepID=A0ABS4AKY2_9PROT|nr:hypothetical protein [Pararoseomonas baculiformis]MBP0447536.1 hypothetical protein [Pararoseomonas baculiformis]